MADIRKITPKRLAGILLGAGEIEVQIAKQEDGTFIIQNTNIPDPERPGRMVPAARYMLVLPEDINEITAGVR